METKFLPSPIGAPSMEQNIVKIKHKIPAFRNILHDIAALSHKVTKQKNGKLFTNSSRQPFAILCLSFSQFAFN